MQRFENLYSRVKSTTLNQCKRKFGMISHRQLINKLRMNFFNQTSLLCNTVDGDQTTYLLPFLCLHCFSGVFLHYTESKTYNFPPIIPKNYPIIPDSFHYLLFQKLFWHN